MSVKSAVLAAALVLFSPAPCEAEVEHLHLRVNGLEMRVRHAHGLEAEALALREADRLRSLGPGALQWRDVASWRMVARQAGQVSSTLQMRGTGVATEVVAADVDVGVGLAHPPSLPVWVPPGAQVTDTIETLGREPSTQWLVRSAWSAEAALDYVSFTAGTRRWTRTARDAAGLQLRRDGWQLRVTAVPASTRAGCSLVLTTWRGP
jgi:hypothetical protein